MHVNRACKCSQGHADSMGRALSIFIEQENPKQNTDSTSAPPRLPADSHPGTRVLMHRFTRLLQPCLPWGPKSSSSGRLPHQRWRTSGGRAESWLCWTLGPLGFANFPEQLLETFCRALWSLPTPNTPSLKALPSPPRPSCCNSQVKFLWGTR